MNFAWIQKFQWVVLVGVISVGLFAMAAGRWSKYDLFQRHRGGKAIPAHSPRPIEHLDAGNFDEKVLRFSGTVLVDFYADWCGPCQKLAPVLEEVAREMPDAKIVKVDVDRNRELAIRYQVSTIPRLLVFRNGHLISQHNGFADKASIIQLLE